MKFRATIQGGAGSGKQSAILHVLHALQRIEKTPERKGASEHGRKLILRLGHDAFTVCHSSGAQDESQTWGHFRVQSLFKEFRIESKRDGNIDLEVSVAVLIHAFKGCAESETTTIRLTTQDGAAILAFEFTLPGAVVDHKVSQSVPVRVVPEPEAAAVQEPPLPEPEYQVELPTNLLRVKTVLDKMRAVGAQQVNVEAQMERPGAAPAGASATDAQGRVRLQLASEAELVSITTTFPHLGFIQDGKDAAPPNRPVRLLLSLKRLSEVLTAFAPVASATYIACLVEGRALVLYALLPQDLGTLISYAPAAIPG